MTRPQYGERCLTRYLRHWNPRGVTQMASPFTQSAG